MKLLGYLKKKTSSQIDASPWGLQYLLREGNPNDLLLDVMGRSGVKWTRLSMGWAGIETDLGRYDWHEIDQAVDALCEQDINIFLCTGSGSHPLYQDYPEGYIHPPTDEAEALEGYSRYAAAMVEHFRDRVRHYEIYNEPNWPLFWRPEPDAEAYGRLVRETATAMRAVDPDITIMAGSLAGVGPGRPEYVKTFMSQPGVSDLVDVITYHPYRAVPETTYDDIVDIRSTARQIDPDVAIWQGECGCPSSGDTIHARLEAPWGYNIQAKWLLRRLLTDYMAGAEVSIYFLVVEFHGNLHPGSPELRTGYNTKGLVQHTTWKLKPAFYALQNLTASIDRTWSCVDEQHTIEVVDSGIFYGIGPHEDRPPCVIRSITLRRGGMPMLVYWLPWRPQEIVEPATADVTWEGAEWQEPVVVDLMTGEVSMAERVEGVLRVRMSDSPMMVTELDALELADEPQQPSYREIVNNLRWTY